MNNYFDTKVYELPIFYTWCVLAAFFVPVYGFFLEVFYPDSIDFMSHRILLGFYWIFVLIFSIKSESVKTKYFIPLSYFGNICSTIWIIWIVYINQFSTIYCIGLLTGMACFGYMYRNFQEIIGYYSFSSIIIVFLYQKIPNPEFDGIVLLLSVFVIFTITMLMMIQKIFFSRSLNNLIHELSVKNDELKQFAYICSHDLKSPLITIKSFLSILNKKIQKKEYEDIPKIKVYLDDSVNKGIELVEDLLNYSVLSETELNYQETNVDFLVNELVQGILLNHKNQDLEINIQKVLPTKLTCVKSQMIQLFQNLIENGIKYNRSSRKKISISVVESKKNYCFKVIDNGIGISKEFQVQIFELFKRLHNNDEFNGSGVGLSICKKIVENHQGEIMAEPIEEGTAFNFTISKAL